MSEEAIYEDPDDILNELGDYVKMYQNQPPSKSKKTYDEMENVTLNIAITGESGVGKSTFVNAIRGLKEGDDGAADTGVTETTMEAIRYSHPTMPNVYIWDLPGIGTPNFKAKKYLKEIHFDNYDFFIIIGTIRFKENDIKLAKEIMKIKKMFYFVRTKIDNDIRAETRKKGFNEEQVLSKIRQSCEENLRALGNPKVFLISTFELGKYDFQNLIDSLETNLSDHKKSALIRSLPVCSLSILEKKRKNLNKTAVAAAAAASTTAAVPIPGFSVGCEIGIMVRFLHQSLIAFGLDEKSFRRISERVNKPEVELRSVLKSRFAEGVNEKVVGKMMQTTAMVTAKTVEVFLTAIPAFGNIGAMGVAFATTLHLLHAGIKEMTEDSKAVLLQWVVSNQESD